MIPLRSPIGHVSRKRSRWGFEWGVYPDNHFLIEQFRVKPRRTLRQKLWSLFGRAD